MTAVQVIWEGFGQALRLLGSGDPQVWRVVWLTLRVSGTALLISALLGVPLGSLLALKRFCGQRPVVALLYTGMGLPPVVVGLGVYLLLSRNGPLGSWGWLFTPRAMILAQVIISLPLVAGFTMSSVMGVDANLRQQLRALGASDRQATWTILREARSGVIVSLVAGLGSIISEVGAVMLVGGNIEGSTRVLTTAIVLETRKGNFELAIALSLILLALTLAANAAMLSLQGRRAWE
jgi:tungstate transport system permease protein